MTALAAAAVVAVVVVMLVVGIAATTVATTVVAVVVVVIGACWWGGCTSGVFSRSHTVNLGLSFQSYHIILVTCYKYCILSFALSANFWLRKS